MQGFLEIAKTDFSDTFSGAFIFPLLLAGIAVILLLEKDRMRKLLLGGLPLAMLFFYWCPLTGMLFMKLLGENVYWRILWLIPLAAVIPYAGCLLIGKWKGIWSYAGFLGYAAVIMLCGSFVLASDEFEPATNVYKLPQYVVDVAELLPDNVHAMVSNRLMPYIRQYNPSITLEYGRNALSYNGVEDADTPNMILYQEAQKPEIDLSVLAPLAKDAGCTFLVLSSNRTYIGNWEDYGYREYGQTADFIIYADEHYQEGQDTRKWED